MSQLHSVDFRKSTKAKAYAWLNKHDIHPIKEHITKDGNKIISRRYRIIDPSLFKTFSTKKIFNNGMEINLIFGYK